MTKSLFILPGDQTFSNLAGRLAKLDLGEIAEIGFFGPQSDEFHDLLDDWLIGIDQEDAVVTLLFEDESSFWEYLLEVCDEKQCLEVWNFDRPNQVPMKIRSELQTREMAIIDFE